MIIDPAKMDFRDLHHLLAGSIVPRPIALVSTRGENGVDNVAPLSSINIACVKPPMLSFSLSTRRRKGGEKKDTLRNIEFAKEFVVNVPVVESIAAAMNKAGAEYPDHVSEFAETGLTPVKADLVAASMVLESPVTFANGEPQTNKMRAIGRLLEPYCRTSEIFEFDVEYTL